MLVEHLCDGWAIEKMIIQIIFVFSGTDKYIDIFKSLQFEIQRATFYLSCVQFYDVIAWIELTVDGSYDAV